MCATDVNEYLREIAGTDYTSKDFRTWGATVIATVLLTRYGLPASAAERTKTINRALRAAAQALGNTLAVCRKSYVHPGVVDAYVADALPPRRMKLRRAGPAHGRAAHACAAQEVARTRQALASAAAIVSAPRSSGSAAGGSAPSRSLKRSAQPRLVTAGRTESASTIRRRQ